MSTSSSPSAALVAELHASLSDGEDHVHRRLDRALTAAWALATNAGVAGGVPIVAGEQGGPWTTPRGQLDDARLQVTSRWRQDADHRWRTLAEKAQQLEALLRVLQPATDTPPATPSPRGGWPDALWVGRWDAGAKEVGGRDDRTSSYGNVQWERAGAPILNSPRSPRVPVLEHPVLGPALCLSLGRGVQRHEVQAAGDADSGWGPGTERWFGFRFALAADFPLEQRDTWAIISQVHQASHSGPPPLELDACRGGLWLRGRGDAYLREVCRLEVDRAYDVVVGLRIGRGVGASRVDVLVDGGHLVRDYRPPVDFGAGCYWKVASAYARPSIRRPWTVFQRDHRIGATLAAVR